MGNDFDNIYVVLVEPKEPGNIGSVVRAMKNMGILHLRLVNPPQGYKDNTEQKKFGYRAQEITQRSKKFANLTDALQDISIAFLATTKKGKWKRDFLLPEQAAELIGQRAHKEKIAVIFGREESGVTIDESQMANYFIYIPMAGTYPSLNLSQAVLLVLYEIFKKIGEIPTLTYPRTAAKKEFERLYDNIWRLMKSLLIREPDKGLFHRSLKRSLNRTRWANADIAVFDRACKQVRWFIRNKTKEDFQEEEP
ncbi:MAG: TrmH family RNA methyltransferase [Candidatus Aminicenantes bacterium]|jgi:TrmH family RNA methyltransferase